MRSRLFALLLALSLLLSACSQPATQPTNLPTPIAQITKQSEVSPIPTIGMEPTQSAEPEVLSGLEDRTVYDLDANLDYAQHTVSVVERITYFNRADQAMSELLLLIPPRYFAGAYSQAKISGDLVTQSRENGIQTMLSLEPALQPG